MNYPAASSGISITLTKRARSKLLSNEPQAIQISPSPSEPRCGLFQIGFLFQVGGFAGRSMARGRYRRQREYPQPPPPSKSTSKITINRVSIVFSFIWVVYSYLNSGRALFVPDLPMRGKGCVSDSFSRLSEGNEETARYKRRDSRPKGRIRFWKDPLEPTNSLTRRNCPRASFIRVYSDDKARWSNPLIFWMCYSSQFQFDDCKSLPELDSLRIIFETV